MRNQCGVSIGSRRHGVAVNCGRGPLICATGSCRFAIAICRDDDVGMAKKATVSDVRAWAKGQGFDLADRGRLPSEVWEAWERRTTTTPPADSEAGTAIVTVEQFAAAQQRIDQLERHVVELNARLTTLESRPAEARRRFARSR